MSKVLSRNKLISKPLIATLAYMFVVFFQSGINLVTTPLFSRILTTDEFGIISTYNSWFSIISIFVTLNLSSGVYNNALLEFENDRDRVTSSFMSIGIFNASIFLIFFLILKRYVISILELPMVLIFYMIVSCLSTSAWGFFLAREKFDYKFVKPLLITIITFLLNPIIGYIAIRMFPNSRAVAKIIGCGLPALIVNLYLFIHILKKGKIIYQKKYWKYALSFNIPLIPHYLSGIILASSDRIMIQKMLGFDFAGIYGIAYQLSLVIQGIFAGINSALIPFTYKNLKKENYERIYEYAENMLVFVIFSSVMIVLCGPEIIKVLAPTEYYLGMYVIPPVVLGLYFSFIAGLFGNIEFFYKKTKFVTFATSFGAILNFILNLLLIPKYGFFAAGYTTLIGYFVIMILHYFYLLHIKKTYIYNIKKMFLLSFVCSIMIFLILFLYDKFICRIIILILIFIYICMKRKVIIKLLKNIKD